jgi:hypothetical protein
MSGGGNYGAGKRQREMERADKQRQKMARRMERRMRGPEEPQVVAAGDVQRGLISVDEAMRQIEQRASGDRSTAAVPARLFVGGLDSEITDQYLRGAFEVHAPVLEASVVRDRDTRASRGFGFVTLENRKDAARVIDTLHGTDHHGRRWVVNAATERR